MESPPVVKKVEHQFDVGSIRQHLGALPPYSIHVWMKGVGNHPSTRIRVRHPRVDGPATAESILPTRCPLEA